MAKHKMFISHVSEEAPLAVILKSHLSQDFLGLVDIFVSSDLESISAGANWLDSIKAALSESSALLALCSRASLNRAWVNFEVGAAWIKPIPIVPICHSGLLPRELPIPFSTMQGIQANTEQGLKRVYSFVAKELGCGIPNKDFTGIINKIVEFENTYRPQLEKTFSAEIQRRSHAQKRVYEALSDPEYKSRSIERLAIRGGITEDEVMELLQPDQNVVFSRSKTSGKRLARLKDRGKAQTME